MTEDTEKTEAEIVAEANQPTEEQKSTEDRARRMGWRPQEEYKGRSEWVDAETFIKRGEQELPVLRERYRQIDGRLAQTETKLTSTEKKLTEATEVLTQLVEMSKTAEERGFVRAMDELRKREVQAVREADEATYNAIQAEKVELEKTKTKAPAAAPVVETKTPTAAPVADAAPNPIVEAWIKENPWFNNDRVLNFYAIDLDAGLMQSHPGLSVEQRLEEVKNRVVERFPEKFENTRRQAPAAVAAPSAPPAKPKGKTVKDLPPEAKEALAKFKRTLPNYTDAEYLKVYFPGEEISA